MTPGEYVLSVAHRRYQAESRDIRVHPTDNDEVVMLGRRGMPFFFRGKVKVPFEPKADRIAVQFVDEPAGDARRTFDALLQRLQLHPEQVHDDIRRHRVGLYRLVRTSESRRQQMLGSLEELPFVRHAGPVVQLRERSLSFTTNELIVCFAPHVSEDAVARIVAESKLAILRSVPYSANTYHLRSPSPASYTLLQVAASLIRRKDVEWAEPNLVVTPELDAITPGDFLWPGVWDRQLVNTPDAWQALQNAPVSISAFGSPDVIIANVDQGIQSIGGVPAHRDFQGTVSSGAAKVYRLFDFNLMVPNNDSPFGNHGMGTAGVATALADNPSPVPAQREGVAGAAPNCRVMGLIFPGSEADRADMYIWAAGFNPNSPVAGFPPPITPGADIFTTSIGFGAGAPISGLASAMLDFLMTYGRRGKGCLCFFSSGNANIEFTTYRPWAAYKKSFGMGASTLANDGVTEIKAPYSDWGPLALCAPSNDGSGVHNPPTGYGTWAADLVGTGNLIGHATVQTTLAAAASAGDTLLNLSSVAGLANGSWLLLDAPGAPGSEPVMVTAPPNIVTNQASVTALLNGHAAGALVASGPNDYQNNFGGTSSATPLAAGVAALVLSANPALTWVEARQILRDTAVKIDAANTDPVGQWIDAGGMPSVTSGNPPVFSQWYGYGRINAAAAVQAALDFTFTRDLVVRENLADIGMVASTGPFWNSPDLWVRNVDPAVEGAAALPANYSTEGSHQSPLAGQDNWVYARVKNVGTTTSLDFYVRVYVTHFAGTEFTYPDSFIPSTRPGVAVPSPMTPGTYLIGEVEGRALAAGADTIVSVRWPAALIPPATVVVGGSTVQWHPCLLLEVSPHDGPAPTGSHVWGNNNLAQKNISIVYVDAGDQVSSAVVVGHGNNASEFVWIELDRSLIPPGIELFVDLVEPILKRRLRDAMKQPAMLAAHRGYTLEFLEETRVRLEPAAGDPHPGLILTVAPQSRLSEVLGETLDSRVGQLDIVSLRGREVVKLAARDKTRIPVFGGRGGLSTLVVVGAVREGTPPGSYVLPLLQRDPAGRESGGAELRIVVR